MEITSANDDIHFQPQRYERGNRMIAQAAEQPRKKRQFPDWRRFAGDDSNADGADPWDARAENEDNSIQGADANDTDGAEDHSPKESRRHALFGLGEGDPWDDPHGGYIDPAIKDQLEKAWAKPNDRPAPGPGKNDPNDPIWGDHPTGQPLPDKKSSRVADTHEHYKGESPGGGRPADEHSAVNSPGLSEKFDQFKQDLANRPKPADDDVINQPFDALYNRARGHEPGLDDASRAMRPFFDDAMSKGHNPSFEEFSQALDHYAPRQSSRWAADTGNPNNMPDWLHNKVNGGASDEGDDDNDSDDMPENLKDSRRHVARADDEDDDYVGDLVENRRNNPPKRNPDAAEDEDDDYVGDLVENRRNKSSRTARFNPNETGTALFL